MRGSPRLIILYILPAVECAGRMVSPRTLKRYDVDVGARLARLEHFRQAMLCSVNTLEMQKWQTACDIVQRSRRRLGKILADRIVTRFYIDWSIIPENRRHFIDIGRPMHSPDAVPS